MALTKDQVHARFGVIRDFLGSAAVNRVAVHSPASDMLESLFTDIAATLEAIVPDDGEEVDLSEILARLAAVELLAAEALETATQQILLMPLPLTAAEVLAITDRALLTEAGDDILIEAGDRILLESA